MKPRLLDLFCGAGGAGAGYARAGFEVIGVDIKPQPRYPFEFHRKDALAVLRRERDYPCGGGMVDPDAYSDWASEWDRLDLRRFDAIHASPPCQHYAGVTRWRGSAGDHPDLVAATRELLEQTGLPWVIENVREAPIRGDFLLCGTALGLRVRRHRHFETNWSGLVMSYGCQHQTSDLAFMHKGERAYADAMGCDWMTAREAREAIPPAYTELIGHQLMQHLEGSAAA